MQCHPTIDRWIDKSPLEAEEVMLLLSPRSLGRILLLVLLVVVVACVPQNACTHHTGGDLLLQLALAASLLLLRDVRAVGQVLNLHVDRHPTPSERLWSVAFLPQNGKLYAKGGETLSHSLVPQRQSCTLNKEIINTCSRMQEMHSLELRRESKIHFLHIKHFPEVASQESYIDPRCN